MKSWLKIYLYLSLFTVNYATAQEMDSIVGTRHDFSLRAPVGSLTDKDDAHCIFCHTPSGSLTKIGVWDNHQASTLFEYPYERPSGPDPSGKPSGSSLLCLSCHDGTIALGDVFSRTDIFSITVSSDEDVSQTDFSDGHPISFVYDSNLFSKNSNLEDPHKLPVEIMLDNDKKLQCTTCHDPHSENYDNFLVMDNKKTALCRACHKMTGWADSSHMTSLAKWNHKGTNPWPYSKLGRSVSEYGCQNCHTPHGAGSGMNLLNYIREEDNCLACHNGNVGKHNILAEITKYSNHPVGETTGVHKKDESILLNSSERHVECVDCHDSHSAKADHGEGLSGALANISGVDMNGSEKAKITVEYELCFRCHADSQGRAAPPTPREHDQTNVRLQFDDGNPSFHPVTGPGTNRDVPSLIAPLTESDKINCSDCHGSDISSREGGNGSLGPHGSIFPSLLVRQYQTQDNTPESPTAYALCYECHDRNNILSNESFTQHDLHVRQESTPCNVCHDPHGISFTQGNNNNNTHLINFDISIVLPNANNELRFEDLGSNRGACFLNCHNSEHDGLSY